MERPATSAGTVTLMGSGELTESMTRVHHWVASRIEGPVSAVFLDTPAGFELNADNISVRARNYVRRHLGVECALATFKSKDKATTAEVRNAVRKIEHANYIFAGPGSPTYAIRNWTGTPLIDAVARRIDEGAHLVLASAAAIAIGHYSVPVYQGLQGRRRPALGRRPQPARAAQPGPHHRPSLEQRRRRHLRHPFLLHGQAALRLPGGATTGMDSDPRHRRVHRLHSCPR